MWERWFSLIGVLAVLSLLGAGWWIAVRPFRPLAQKFPTPSPEDPSPPTVHLVTGRLMAEVPERRERWILHYRHSEYDPERKVAVTEGGVCQVWREGERVALFTAPKVVVYFAEKEMVMTGGVTVIAFLPRLRVHVPSLHWRWDTGHLWSSGGVKLEGERFWGRANRLEGDTTLQHIRLRGDVHLHWHTKGGGTF